MDGDKHKLTFKDPDDPEKKITLTFHVPTPEEWFKYRARFFRIRKETVPESDERMERLYKLHFDCGLPLLEDLFDPGGILGIITGDPDWQQALGRKSPDLVIEIGMAGFERLELLPEKN